MGIGKLGLVFCIVVLVSIRRAFGAFTPEDNYLIDCGSLENTTIGARTFVSDAFLSSAMTAPGSISASTSSKSVSSFDSSALYQTARIFTASSSYSFSIRKQGRHFIRLYFFPFVFRSYNLSAASFAVSTDDLVLLHNFRPQGNSSPVFSEYLVNINRDELTLSFAPSGNPALAFVNGIEVVSVPDYLINDTAQTVHPLGQYQGLSAQPLETVYRINMGGPKVTSENDTLWRTWVNDLSFLLDRNLSRSVSYSGTINYLQGGATPETAPSIVYSTATELESSNTSNALFNVTWEFDVDANSGYFIRLHFCDIVSKALEDLYFDVYVNGWSAVSDLDLSQLSFRTLAAPVFMDFVLAAGDAPGKLRISIGPSTLPNVLPDGILNGLEIMKMNISAAVVAPPGSKKSFGVILGSVGGAVAVAAIVASVLLVAIRRRKMGRKPHSKKWMPFFIDGPTSHSTGSKTSNGTAATFGQDASFGFRFSLAVVQEATNNFDENWVIGVGGFGKVYKGVLRDETRVAVKRGNPKSQQGLNEFRTEIELLSRLRHRHLVSLIGYCDEWNEMILVYEYMERGTLKSHLYGSELPASLSWEQRLEICIGSARGLHYLHTGFAKAIIHRDVKSANILLDENLMAKVADFGLSKTGPDLDQTHVSTAVKGSFGYLDPEYFRRQHLTEKSDVYSFGVVLLEVLCARPVIDPTLPREMVNLAEWAMKWQKRGELKQIVDPRIAGMVRSDSLRKFGETVEKCLADYGVERPTMGDVLWNLEYALHLQEADLEIPEVDSIGSINRTAELSSRVQKIGKKNLEDAAAAAAAAAGEVSTSSSNKASDDSMSRVFSQLIKAEGR